MSQLTCSCCGCVISFAARVGDKSSGRYETNRRVSRPSTWILSTTRPIQVLGFTGQKKFWRAGERWLSWFLNRAFGTSLLLSTLYCVYVLRWCCVHARKYGSAIHSMYLPEFVATACERIGDVQRTRYNLFKVLIRSWYFIYTFTSFKSTMKRFPCGSLMMSLPTIASHRESSGIEIAVNQFSSDSAPTLLSVYIHDVNLRCHCFDWYFFECHYKTSGCLFVRRRVVFVCIKSFRKSFISGVFYFRSNAAQKPQCHQIWCQHNIPYIFVKCIRSSFPLEANVSVSFWLLALPLLSCNRSV